MDKKVFDSISSSYGPSNCFPDRLEILLKRQRELFFGVDYSIFKKTIRYYSAVKGIEISKEEALSKALNKAQHKEGWYKSDRKTLEDKMHFYLEVDIYPFRQPYNNRFGGFRWYRNLVKHFDHPSILEYGCGSAVLTEYLFERFSGFCYSVADIPSVTLDFVTWKKAVYKYPYNILTIGPGKEGIPLSISYDLIICKDVLEHTPNPLEIVTAFTKHLSPGGVLVLDFLNAPGGENLQESTKQRESVKDFLNNNLIALKAIDKPSGNDGLYVKNNS